ncbi:MAG: thioredoxin [Candidatus Gracilibacteria bacterium]|jgi:thioredoxin 1
MSKPITITHKNFEEEVLKSKIPVLVDFWAPWCGPCQMMSPVLDALAEELDGKVKIGKVNTEESENMPLTIKYQIQSIPNMKLFKNGAVVKDFIGMRPKETFNAELSAEL